MTKNDPRLWCVAVAALLGIAAGCAAESPQGSSSSHWVRCTSDEDCDDVPDASECANDGYCVDETGERVTETGSSVSTTTNGDDGEDAGGLPPSGVDSASLVSCNPLSPWVAPVDASDPFVVASDASGTVYVVTSVSADFILRSDGDRLLPLPLTASLRSDGVQLLRAVAPEGAIELELAPEEAPTSARLLPAGAAPNDAEELTLLSNDALSDFEVEPIVAPARVVAHGGTPEDGEIVVLGSDFGWSDLVYRAFYGTGGTLAEIPLHGWSEGEAGELRFDLTLPGDRSANLAVRDQSVVEFVVDGTAEYLRQRSPTGLALSQLDYQCLEPVARRFQLSNDPPSPERAMSCRARLPIGACVATSNVMETQGPEAAVEVVLEGTVLELGAGVPPTEQTSSDGQPVGCPFGSDGIARFGDLPTSDPAVEAELVWIRLDDPNGEAWITLRAPNMQLPFSVGDGLRVHQRSVYDFGGPTDSFIEIRDENDALLVWLGQDFALLGLDAPDEIALTRGAELCATPDTCGDSSDFALDVGIGGTTVTLLLGEQTQVGEFFVVHAALREGTSLGQCDDYVADFVRVGIWLAP